MQSFLSKTISIILTVIVLTGLSNLTAYSQTANGIAKTDGTFLVPEQIISSHIQQTTTPNVSATDIRIEKSGEGHNLVFVINGEKNEVELTEEGDILYLPTPEVKGNEVTFSGGIIVWNYATFYSMINQ
ncbi:MAG: hypothetical protein FWG85_05300 [Bacteroidetes bacterium]|nr:hypothetical protein [Bacteroidota bacterium]